MIDWHNFPALAEVDRDTITIKFTRILYIILANLVPDILWTSTTEMAKNGRMKWQIICLTILTAAFCLG